MDRILLNQKLTDWDKACRYFAVPDILAQLSNEEKRAVDFLVNYWRDQEFNPAACEPHITVLKSSDKLHSSNREIIEHSKMLRGIAQTFYTKDAASFNIFRSALGWKPKQNNQTPTPEGAPKHNDVMMMGWVEKWAKAMQYLKSADIIPQLEQSELTAIEQLGDMWHRPKYSPDMKREAEEYIATLTASHKYHASNRDIIEQSKNLCHVARNIYANEETFTTFRRVLTKYISEHKPPRREHIPTPTPTPTPKPNPTKTNRLTIQIKDVKFKDEDFDGNIIRDSGSRLYSDVEYLAPQITYQVLQTGAPIDIWYKIYSPNGSLIYGNDSKAGFTWKGTVRCDAMTTFTVTLGGFGNTNKNCYEQTGTWRIEFYEGDKCLYKTTFEIYPKTTYTPPIKRTPTPTPPIKPIRTSSWDKFKDVIEDIGDWFEDDSPEFIGPLLHVISLIVYITYIVMAWNDNGFLGALLTGVIGMFLLGIAYYVNVVLAKIVQWVFRFIFYNVWTLIASLIIGLLCLLAPSVLNIVDNSSRDKVEATPVEQVVQTTTYYCISKSGLKVRNAPSTSAPQLGSLVYGEAVEVIQIVGEFAKIKYEQAEKEYAWVSRNYISRTMPSQPATPKANAISITSVKFANSDYNGYNMTNYGVQLYSDLQYLTPRVTIKPLSAEKKCELQMKIFCPDQSLMTGATSPEGYTYSKEVTIYKNNPVIRLPGWGSKSGDLYTPGTYRFEIWCDGDKLYTTNIDIKSRE